MKRVVATGRTVEDAVTSALVRLGVTRSQATVKVLNEPVKGLFGFIGGKDAEVEVTVNALPEESAREFLIEVLQRMGISAKVRTRTELDSTDLTLEVSCGEDELPYVIGRHGSTLDALQYLVNTAANRGQEKFSRFFVDAGEYRRRRKEGLCQIADRAAVRAVRTRNAVALEAMSAADRKVIHTYLQERTDVTTSSQGVEPNRKVVVVPVGESGEELSPRSKSYQRAARPHH